MCDEKSMFEHLVGNEVLQISKSRNFANAAYFIYFNGPVYLAGMFQTYDGIYYISGI